MSVSRMAFRQIRASVARPRLFSTTSIALRASAPPKSRDRGPPSKETTQTDFNAMDIFTHTPPPSTAIDACLPDGFVLDSGLTIADAGVLLLAGEALKWRPWTAGRIYNTRGQIDISEEAWGALRVVWPKPDLLIVGTGKGIRPLAPASRKALAELGIRVEVQDTRNAAGQFNLLATERGVQTVAAALVPVGWRED